MNTIQGTYKNGHIELDRPADWPEGCRVTVEAEAVDEIRFMTEEEQSNSPEAIASWLAEFDAIPPLPMTPAAEAGWLAWQDRVKDYTIEAVRRQMQGGAP